MHIRRWTPTLLATAILVIAIPFGLAGQGQGEPDPANKTAAAGATMQYMPPDFADDEEGVTILSTYLKSGGPKDLLLTLSLECALWTEVASTTIGNHPAGLTDVSEARAHVQVWIEVAGQRVPVAGSDDGAVTFCDRVHRQSIEDMDESTGNWTLRQYLATKTASAFTWVHFDVGSGTHLIEVKADIDAYNTSGLQAEGAIGKRTLIVETTSFPNGASI